MAGNWAHAAAEAATVLPSGDSAAVGGTSPGQLGNSMDLTLVGRSVAVAKVGGVARHRPDGLRRLRRAGEERSCYPLPEDMTGGKILPG